VSASPQKPKRSCLRIAVRVFVVLFALSILLVIAAAFGAYLLFDYVTGKGTAGPPVRVEVPAGVTGNQAGALLADAGLIDHEILFRIATRLDTVKTPIKQGFYNIPAGLSPTEILRMLQEGPNIADAPFKVTVAEGQTIRQTASQLKDPDAFIRAASDPELIRSLGLKVSSLEGFLMPSTYFFTEDPKPEELVRRMLEEFKARYADLLREIPQAASSDMLEVVTIASLVEEESRVDDERATIASVIYNRLERKMTLDFDSTLQFALDKYGQRLLDSDKQVDSPYNTYRNTGLPPGPISSPGVASIRAALQPLDTEYLFFVSNADGKTHTFSKTLSEHNDAVAKFRREIAIQRRAQAADAENDSEQQ